VTNAKAATGRRTPKRSDTISFPTQGAFRSWLGENHSRSEGIWLRIYKKVSDVPSVTYAQALDEALCYGWIDGQKQKGDSTSWLQRFTPRRRGSGWSKINTQHAERLIKSGEMTPAGLKEVEAARRDGRWKAAYDSFGSAQPPNDFLSELNKNRKAKAFFETLDRRNVYAILYRLQTAKKPETRSKRIQQFIDMLARHEKLHP
jgi:uncharacterized protein YdeI (YjbR/CyaY-like superfamily)